MPDLSKEPDIVINGQPLSTAEAMTIRVALGAYLSMLSTEGLGDDATGKSIYAGYTHAIHSIHTKMRQPN